LDNGNPVGSVPGGATLTVSGRTGTAKTLFNATTNDDSSLPGTPGTSAVTIGVANDTITNINGYTNNITASGAGASNNFVAPATLIGNANTFGASTAGINVLGATGVLDLKGATLNLNDSQGANVTNIGTGTTTGAVNIGNSANTTSVQSGTNLIGTAVPNSVNTIGNAYTSTNTMQGNTNTISSAGGANQLQTNAAGAGNGTTLSGSGVTNGVVISGSNEATPLVQSQVILNSTTASMATPTAGGGSVVINNNTSTVLSGGTAAGGTTMTLDNNGASFANNGTGAPVRVGGIADGVAPNDAVNKRQYDLLDNKLGGVADKAYAGVASALAMSALPQIRPGFNYNVGMAVGNYANQSAVAIGAKANIGTNWQVNASAGVSQGNNAVAVGAGFSW